jgi:hypothetical protein
MLHLFDGFSQQGSPFYCWSSEGWERSNCRQHIFRFFYMDSQLINMHLQPVESHLLQDEVDPVESVILPTEILHYFGIQWSRFHHGMRNGVHANASSDTARHQNDVLREVNNVEDQLEDLEFMYVYGDQWEEYRKLALAKFEDDEESRVNSMDELHGHAKVDAALRVFDDSDC